MPIEKVTRTIIGANKTKYELAINQFHAFRGFAIKTRLERMLLPVLGQVVGGADLIQLFKDAANKKKSNEEFLENLDLGVMIPKALSKLVETVDENKLQKFLLDLFSTTWIDDKELNQKVFDEVFVGNYNLIYKVAYAVVDINNFFDFGDIGAQLTELAEKSQTPVSPENSKESLQTSPTS